MKHSFIAFLMLLISVPWVSAADVGSEFAVDGLRYRVESESEATMIKADKDLVHVVIPQTVSDGAGTYRVTGIGGYAFFHDEDAAAAESVEIPEGVTKLAPYAFYAMKSLKEIGYYGNRKMLVSPEHGSDIDHTPLDSDYYQG